MSGAPENVSARLRALCLALPEAEEVIIRRGPTFRVAEKIFALDRGVDRRPSVWFKAPAGVQSVMTEAKPDAFFSPPYYGAKGWVGLWLDGAPDWGEVEALMRRSYRLTAPKRLSALAG